VQYTALGNSKIKRIEDGLRSEVGAVDYSGAGVVEICRDLLARAFIGQYPFRSEALASYFMPKLQQEFQSATQVVRPLPASTANASISHPAASP
jgi:hypothetical protein